MSDDIRSEVYNNVLPSNGSEKLYLNSRTADVHFAFPSECDESERISAHKCILSAISPAFDAMFYGPNQREGDIAITDASPDAFKQFLQFFYRSQVKLTAEHVQDVLNLGKQYLIDSCVHACAELCRRIIKTDNLCWGYEIAILFELDDLKKFCEEQISEKAAEIFQTDDFLNCRPNVLSNILRLDSLKCDEATVFDGCISWAKQTCTRKHLDRESGQNLRLQLGDLLYEIRFGEMSNKDFQQRFRLYDGLFSFDEYKDINMMIACKEFKPEKFNRNARSASTEIPTERIRVGNLECNRILRSSGSPKCKNKSWTTFTSNSRLRLKKVFIHTSAPLLDWIHNCNVSIKVFRNGVFQASKTSGFEGIDFDGHLKKAFELPNPIEIMPGVRYTIVLDMDFFGFGYYSCESVQMEQGAIINFKDENSFVSGLCFEQV